MFDMKWFIRNDYGSRSIGENSMNKQTRCPWAGDIPIYMDYHDHEWGRPVHNDNKLFEMLILEGMQAGLS